MSRSNARDWQHFASKYYATLDYFGLPDPQPMTMDCGTNEAAMTTRLDLYNLFGALRRQQVKFKDKGDIASYESINCSNWVAVADTLIMKVRGSQVLISRRPFADVPRIRKFDPELHERMKKLVQRNPDATF